MYFTLRFFFPLHMCLRLCHIIFSKSNFVNLSFGFFFGTVGSHLITVCTQTLPDENQPR